VVAEFLSDAWIAAFSAAVASIPHAIDSIDTLVVEQHVTGAPDGDVCYHIVFTDGHIDVQAGPSPDPDIRMTTDYETAVAVHRGETNAQHAVAKGKMHVRGAFQVLLRHADALNVLADAFTGLRATTTFPPGTSR
jgi:SCP-2 sterol transfer family protein